MRQTPCDVRRWTRLCAKLLTPLLLGALLPACATLTVTEERQLGAQIAREMRGELLFIRDPVVVDYVGTIGGNILRAAGPQPFEYRFMVVEDDEINAFAGPGGYVYIHTETVLRARNASELAAVLAFSAVANHDRVGAALFTDKVESYVAPAGGRDHALRIVRDLLAFQPVGRRTNLEEAFRFAARVMKRRGIVAVISDFQDRGYERALGILRRRHDVIALQLWDPREAEVPAAGLVSVTDPETGERMVVDTAHPVVRRRLRASTIEEAREAFRRTRVDALPLSTAESYERPLTSFFKARERRR